MQNQGDDTYSYRLDSLDERFALVVFEYFVDLCEQVTLVLDVPDPDSFVQENLF